MQYIIYEANGAFAQVVETFTEYEYEEAIDYLTEIAQADADEHYEGDFELALSYYQLQKEN